MTHTFVLQVTKAGQSSGNKANPWQTLHHHIVARLLRALGPSKWVNYTFMMWLWYHIHTQWVEPHIPTFTDIKWFN